MKVETVNDFEVNDIEIQYAQDKVANDWQIHPIAVPAQGPERLVGNILGLSQWVVLLLTIISFVVYIGKVISAKVKKEKNEDTKKYIKRSRLVFLIFLILFIILHILLCVYVSFFD